MLWQSRIHLSQLLADQVMITDKYGVHGEDVELLGGSGVAAHEVVVGLVVGAAFGVIFFTQFPRQTRAERQKVVGRHVHHGPAEVVQVRPEAISKNQRQVQEMRLRIAVKKKNI